MCRNDARVMGGPVYDVKQGGLSFNHNFCIASLHSRTVS